MSGNGIGNSLTSRGIENLFEVCKTVKEMETTYNHLFESLMSDENIRHIDRFEAALPLVFRSSRGEEYLDILLKDLDVNDRDEDGDTALHCTVRSAYIFCTEDHHTLRKLITLKLLSKGLDINSRNDWGETPLFCAANDYLKDSMYMLLQNKADPDVKDECGKTALLNVVSFTYKGADEIVRLLLESGADVNAKDGDGWTALEHVINQNDGRDSTLFTELLIWGGSLFVTSRNGRRLLDELIYSIRKSLQLRLRSNLLAALVEYIVALQSAKLDCSEYAVVESTFPFKNIISPSLARCQIEEVKKTKCGSYSLYDVFGKYRDPTFVCDKNVEDAVNKACFKIKYVDYGSLLKAKFASAKRRYKMMAQAMYKLTNKLPVEIVWKILTYLRDEDLESVTTAVSL